MDINWQSISIYGYCMTSRSAYYSCADISPASISLHGTLNLLNKQWRWFQVCYNLPFTKVLPFVESSPPLSRQDKFPFSTPPPLQRQWSPTLAAPALLPQPPDPPHPTPPCEVFAVARVEPRRRQEGAVRLRGQTTHQADNLLTGPSLGVPTSSRAKLRISR